MFKNINSGKIVLVLLLLLLLCCVLSQPLFATENIKFYDDFSTGDGNWTKGRSGTDHNWVWCESSYERALQTVSATPDNYLTMTQAVDVSGTIKFRFSYRHNTFVVTRYLRAYVYNGSSWVKVFDKTGTEYSIPGIDWTDVEVDVSQYANSNFKVRFSAYTSPNNIDIDNVAIVQVVPGPGDFSLTGPDDGATNVSVTPTFSWTAAAEAANYDVYYGTTSPGTLQDNVTGTSYTVPAALATSTVYYWKIVAKNAEGETTASGAPRSFTTTSVPAPGSFTLTGPTNGAADVSVTPTFSWSVASGATSYDIYYGLTSPGMLQDNVTGTSYNVPPALYYNKTYYWKVVAKNAGGEIAAAGAPWSFTTIVPEYPTTEYTYDTLDRLIKTTQVIDGVPYVTETAYDDLNRPVVVTYPDGSQVHYTYNGYNGSVAKIGSAAGGDQYLKGMVYDQYGMLTSKTLGNDVTLNYTYDPDNFRLNRVTANNNLP